MNPKTKEALVTMENRLNQIDQDLMKPEVMSDVKKLTDLNIERSSLEETVNKYHEYLETQKTIDESAEMLKSETDPEMIQMLKEADEEAKAKMPKILDDIQTLLIPKDPADDKNVIMEIRGAAGGDEGNIFAGDLFRMYSRWAENNGYKIEILDAAPGTAGGYSTISFKVVGKGAYSKLKFESGAHRVQRVPKTESKGRIQTSTATVAVLPEVAEVDVHIKSSDLRIDTYRASGAGGQHVNTTDSAVRITHLPTGIVSSSQDQRSQIQNREVAMEMLRAKVYEAEKEARDSKIAAERKSAVGTGSRSEKIRTYNYAQNRVTDHRIGLTLNKLDQVMEGNIDELIDALVDDEQKKKVSEHIDEDK